MAKHRSEKFKFRAFLGVYMGISAIIMTVSGIILYIAPPGRIAHWSYWAMLGFTKTEWQHIHTIFTFIFVIAGIWHIYYNWKPLMNYLRRKSKEASKIRQEMVVASIFSLLVFVGTYWYVFPFSTVLDFGEEITDSWSNKENEPPIPHAEELTVGEFARVKNIPVQKFQHLLEQGGYQVTDTSMTLQQIAEKYNVTPNVIAKVVPSTSSMNTSTNTGYMQGSGFGRKLLSEILNENNLNWNESIAKLKAAGITVEQDDKLKNIANENHVLPIDIIKILEL